MEKTREDEAFRHWWNLNKYTVSRMEAKKAARYGFEGGWHALGDLWVDIPDEEPDDDDGMPNV